MLKIKPVDTFAELNARVERATACRSIGIDTEFLRNKTYYPALCLIQCCTEADEFCVDALAIDDLSPLQRLFGNPDIVKILHSGRQDAEAFEQRLDHPLVNVFDTQIAASFCGSGDQTSYASLVESICQVTLSKSHTRTDWSVRPLSQGQLRYAIDDVRYLHPIRMFLQDRLAASGKLNWHQSECLRIFDKRDWFIPPESVWKRLGQGAKLPKKQQHIARDLAIWRETTAQARNLPRQWVLSTQALLDICSQRPRNRHALAAIRSVSKKTVGQFGRDILQALEKASVGKPDSPVWNGHSPLPVKQRRQVKEIMEKLRSKAQAENISPTLLASRRDIEALITGDTDILLMKGWRYDLIGRELQADLPDSTPRKAETTPA